DIAYVGDHGTKLLGLTDLNGPAVGAGWDPVTLKGCTDAPGPTNCAPNGALETASQPFSAKFPYLGFIDYLSNLDESNYNGLQLTLTQRTSHGLSFVAGYTFSHALDMCEDNWSCSVPIDQTRPGLLYSSS